MANCHEICQIRQYFPLQIFPVYGNTNCYFTTTEISSCSFTATAISSLHFTTSTCLAALTIVQCEYNDFNTLLTKSTFVDTMGQPSSLQQPALIKISLFATWMEAWNIYLSIRICNNLGRALKLTGYQRLIFKV